MTKPAKVLQEEIVRAVRAGRKMGAKSVRIEANGVTVEVRLEDDHIQVLPDRQPSSPPPPEEPKFLKTL